MKFKGIVNISNEEYHKEKEHLSSSNYKSLLKDPGIFYKEKILGERNQVSPSTQNIFDEGTLAHTLILEPENLKQEFAFFSGMRKSGQDWEQFKSDESNIGKVLISKAQHIRVKNWVDSYNKHPVAKSFISGGFPEHTLFSSLLDIPTKVRADYINIDKGYIVDVKTTSNPADVYNFKFTVDGFGYDISSALYLKMFELHYKKSFEFYFIVLSKRDFTCEVYKLSKSTRNAGEISLLKAVDLYKKCKESGIWSLTSDNKDDNLLLGSDYEILEV